jgi:16S rRNA (cytidine1402-2'-O)-methyltransferase
MAKTGKLYLIPTLLGDTPPERVVPAEVLAITGKLTHFIAENERTARRYLKKAGTKVPLNDLVLFRLDKRSTRADLPRLIAPLLEGKDMGLISEAGLPAIADPGASVVAFCHDKKIDVVPLTGASSIILALIASGFSGQSFAFHGYLPIDAAARKKAIRNLERQVESTGQTQLFMETPFRNEKLLEELIKTCNANTRLCIACDLTTEKEEVRTLSIKAWKGTKISLHKRPCIFALGQPG